MNFSIPSELINHFEVAARQNSCTNLGAETFALILGIFQEDTIQATEIVFPSDQQLGKKYFVWFFNYEK